MNKSWNERFNVSVSKDNGQVHELYREYFSKPRGKRLMSLTSPKRYSPKTTTPPNVFPRITPRSRTLKVRWQSQERNWDSRFNVSFSKDNKKFHWSFREYFDSPKDLNYPLLSTQRQIFTDRKSTSPRHPKQ